MGSNTRAGSTPACGISAVFSVFVTLGTSTISYLIFVGLSPRKRGNPMSEKIKMLNPKRKLSIVEVEDMFIRKCRVKNLTDESILSYKVKLRPFMDYYGEEKRIDMVTPQDVDDYILWLKDNKKCCDITINSYLRSLRAFLYYAMECGYLQNFKIRLIKAEKKIKPTYTDDELIKLLKKPDTLSCSFSEYKTWVFINYLIGTGNRISTALNVRIGGINFESNVINLRHTKNRKQQIIPLSNSLAEVLKEYLIIRGGLDEDYLFCNDYGRKADKRTYQQLVHDFNIKRNVNKTSCHLFRHTFAKNWIMSGGDMFRLQKILGHRIFCRQSARTSTSGAICALSSGPYFCRQ